MSHWTVARTHPNCEKIAIHNLERQGFSYYQPKILERKKKKKQGIVLAESPLFPCYLFVMIEKKWISLQSTYGIAAVLSAGSVPAIVRDSIIDDLKKRELNGYIQLPKPAKFDVGDRVTIKQGAFAEHQALVERMPSNERQKVLLALLSNQIRVLVSEEQLEAA